MLAAYTTGLVRAMLSEALGRLPVGTVVATATTGGFLSSAPLAGIDVTGSVATVFAAARARITPGKGAVWEEKHRVAGVLVPKTSFRNLAKGVCGRGRRWRLQAPHIAQAPPLAIVTIPTSPQSRRNQPKVALAQILRFRAMLHVRMPIGSALEPVWRSSARSVVDASGMVGSPWLCPTGAHVCGSGLLPPTAPRVGEDQEFAGVPAARRRAQFRKWSLHDG
jgi:hypothetical protein